LEKLRSRGVECPDVLVKRLQWLGQDLRAPPVQDCEDVPWLMLPTITGWIAQ
jgi:hypothetical protein